MKLKEQAYELDFKMNHPFHPVTNNSDVYWEPENGFTAENRSADFCRNLNYFSRQSDINRIAFRDTQKENILEQKAWYQQNFDSKTGQKFFTPKINAYQEKVTRDYREVEFLKSKKKEFKSKV